MQKVVKGLNLQLKIEKWDTNILVPRCFHNKI